MPEGLQLIGFAARTSPSLFPCSCSVHLHTVRLDQIVPGSSSYAVPPLQSSFFTSPARTFRLGQTYLGFRSSSRHHLEASTHRVCIPAHATFRPQAFSASRRLAPLRSFAGLFHPTATSRIVPFRGFSLHAAAASSSNAPFPHAVETRELHIRRCSHSHAPRLRGFDPHEAAFLWFGN